MVKTDKLDNALNQNPDLVAKLFNAGGDSGKTSEMGIARRLKEALNSYTKSDGLLTARIGRSDNSVNSQMGKQIAALTSQISAQEDRLDAKYDSLIKKFAAMETALSNFQAQQTQLSNSLSQLG